jgi:vancomycin resistance protein VanJ
MLKLISFLAGSYGAIIIGWQIAINTGIRDYWLVELLNNFGVWFYLPLAIFLPWLINRKMRKQLGILLLIPVLLFTWEYSWCLLPGDSNSGGTSLRVMSWNLHYDNPNPSAIGEVIKSQHPDVIAVQELVGSTATPLTQVLSRELPYSAISTDFEFGVWSRYPVESNQPPEIDRRKGQFQQVKMSIEGREIELINVHLSTPAYRVERWGFIPVFGDYNTHKQARIYTQLFSHLQGIKAPLLVVGDFNTSDRHDRYRRMSKLLTNAFERAGWGFGLTYPAVFPLVRIDHIFHSSHWYTHSAWTAKGVGSDHQYLVAELGLK